MTICLIKIHVFCVRIDRSIYVSLCGRWCYFCERTNPCRKCVDLPTRQENSVVALHSVYAHPRRVRTITHLGGVFPELYNTSNNDFLKSFLNKDIIIFFFLKKGKKNMPWRQMIKCILNMKNIKAGFNFSLKFWRELNWWRVNNLY